MPPRKERIKIICAECGKEFYLLECQRGRNRGKFCSQKCLSSFRRHGSVLYCAMCDSPFYRRYGEQDRGIKNNQFCSKKCYSEWRVTNSKKSTYLKSGAVHLHRIVAEEVLRRPLSKTEVVHHMDNDKKNNHPLNLVVFPSQADHARCHFGKMSEAELNKFRLVNM